MPLLEICLAVLTEAEICIAYEPEIASLMIYLTGIRTYSHLKTCTRMFMVVLFIIANKNKKSENTQMLIKSKIDKL